MTFDPNAIAIDNGNIFGLPCSVEEAEIVIIPVPWDATASYGKGAANGPEIIRDASLQLDFYHPNKEAAWETKVAMLPINEEWAKWNQEYQQLGMDYIAFLEKGNELSSSSEFQNVVEAINGYQLKIQKEIESLAGKYRSEGKKVAILGGEHSTPFGLISALATDEEFGILQIDAHADLREAYEGFDQSHASIMYNVLKLQNVKKLVQVGIRDICQEEVDRINSDERVTTFYDWDIKDQQFNGKNWSQITQEIIDQLPEKVYISFDIDGLSPDNCPDTGTPVPGGLSFSEAIYLLRKLKKSRKEIVGFDLNEVADGHEINAIVGARILWELVVSASKS